MKKVMAGLLLVFSGVAVADDFYFEANAHPAAKMVSETLTQAIKIMKVTDRGQKAKKFCQLIKARLDDQYVGGKWLGKYAQLSRDKTSINKFMALVPSIIVTRMFDGIDDADSGKATVDPSVKTVSKNVVAVSTHVYDASNRPYQITIWVKTTNPMEIMDGRYLGFSAVDYMAKEYQRILDAEYRKDTKNSMPVTELVKQTEAESGFIRCN